MLDYSWVMIPNENENNMWNSAQKAFIWIEIIIQISLQIFTSYQWKKYAKEENMSAIRIESCDKEDDENQFIHVPQYILDWKQKVLYILLNFGLGFTHGYSNMKVQNSVGENHNQLLIYSFICICNWYEAKLFLGGYDFIICCFSFLLCAFIDVKNISSSEIFFIFLSFILLFGVNILCFQFQQIQMDIIDPSQQKSPRSQTANPFLHSSEDQINGYKKATLSPPPEKQKRVMFVQLPYTQSLRFSNNLRYTLDGNGMVASRKTLLNTAQNSNPQTIQQSEQLIQDNKISRILNSNYANNNNSTNIKNNPIISVQESMNQHILFYKGMIDKLDSAIFVIGGPNKVYEPLNQKAETFFTDYFGNKNISNVDFVEIFKKITLKHFNKSCLQFLESIGISKLDQNTSNPSTPNKQQKGSLLQLFNSQLSNYQRIRQPSLGSKLLNQAATQIKTLNSVQSSEQYNEDDAIIENNRSKKSPTTSSNNSIYHEITLFNLIQKLLNSKNNYSFNEKDFIEIIDFKTTKELKEILKFVQIKLYGYQLNDEQFIFLQFSNNQEREEQMRETIHKDIEYSTFKTISHELGTYINFMLLILEGKYIFNI